MTKDGILGHAECACGDRFAADCPGEWEPGCDLGANAEHARPAAPEVAAQVDAALGIKRALQWLTDDGQHNWYAADQRAAPTSTSCDKHRQPLPCDGCKADRASSISTTALLAALSNNTPLTVDQRSALYEIVAAAKGQTDE